MKHSNTRRASAGLERQRASRARLSLWAAILLAANVAIAGLDSAAVAVDELSGPLRSQDDVVVETSPVAVIEDNRTRMTFYKASWTGGHSYVHDLSVRSGDSWVQVTSHEGILDEQWVVLTGDSGSAANYYGTMTEHWVTFDDLKVVGERSVELEAHASDVYDLKVRWSLDGRLPKVSYTLTPQRDEHYVVGLQSFEERDFETVDEVLCGSRQHARVIDPGVGALGHDELMFPGCLIQQEIDGQPFTTGLVAPADQIPFVHDQQEGPDNQPYGMSLRNDSQGIQVVGYAPQIGDQSRMKPGEPIKFTFGVYARPNVLFEGYRDLVRNEYEYTNYRKNIFETSLTDTMFNLMDLVLVEPEGDDSEEFVPSPSGWWNRAKGFVDIENDQAIRTSTSGVLLSAYYLTGNDKLYDDRALPMIENHVSRNGHGWTPKEGYDVYGNHDVNRVGSIVFDASSLGPLYSGMREMSAGIGSLAMDAIQNPPSLEVAENGRSPMSTALAAYRMTGKDFYLTEAKQIARQYIEDEINKPYIDNVSDLEFQYGYVKSWTEILELYKITGEQEFLDAAYAEAKRFLTQHFVRPVPEGEITVPTQGWTDSTHDNWNPHASWNYPKAEPDTETVDKWIVSTNGATFEQLTTYRHPTGGPTMIPTWAPLLLQLAEYTGDELLADVAHNSVIGRFTNYPGYYYRQFNVDQMKPDFPYQGPPGLASIYYHHIPAQLGLTMEYLVTEHMTRSGGEIYFPSQFESNFVFFKFHTFGHAPGKFYGDENVWLWMPKGIAEVDNPQVNWLTAEGNGKLYMSLTNESERAEKVEIKFNDEIVPLDPDRAYPVTVTQKGGARSPAIMRDGQLELTVPAKGITAVKIRGVDVDEPLHRPHRAGDTGDASHHVEDGPVGKTRGMLLVKPDQSRYDAYIHTTSREPATLTYSTDGGATWKSETDTTYPNEWTIPVTDISSPITYTVESDGHETQHATLSLPPSITGTCFDGADECSEITPARSQTAAGGTLRIKASVRNDGTGPITKPVLSVDVPEGWKVEPVDTPSDIVKPGEATSARFDVTVPVGHEVGEESITGTARFIRQGEQRDIELQPARVRVVSAVRLGAVKADPAAPGDDSTIRVTVLNRSAVQQEATVRLDDLPSDWKVSPGLQQHVALDGGQSKTLDFTATAPSNAPRGGTLEATASLMAPHVDEATVQLTVATSGVVVNTRSPLYHEEGNWRASGLVGNDGQITRYADVGGGGESATWTPEVPSDGSYNVYVWFPGHQNNTTEATYVVEHHDGTSEYVVNQQNGGDWVKLGTHDFAEGTDGSVKLVVDGPGVHRADAVWFEPADDTTGGPVKFKSFEADPEELEEPGDSTTVKALLVNPSQYDREATVTLGELPSGWAIDPSPTATVDVPAGEERTVEFSVVSPTDASPGSSVDITAKLAPYIDEADLRLTIASNEVIVDTTSPSYEETGTWFPSGLRGYSGATTRYSDHGGRGDTATWTPELKSAGAYNVYVWFPAHENSTTAASYTIKDRDAATEYRINQQENGGAWIKLGTHEFDEGSGGSVTLTAAEPGVHRADAVRFEPLE